MFICSKNHGWGFDGNDFFVEDAGNPGPKHSVAKLPKFAEKQNV